MPAEKFTKKARTTADQRQWDHVYQSSKKAGDPPSVAVRKANAVLAKKKK